VGLGIRVAAMSAMSSSASPWLRTVAALSAAIGLVMSGMVTIVRCDAPRSMPCCQGSGMSNNDRACCSTAMCDARRPAVPKEEKITLPAARTTTSSQMVSGAAPLPHQVCGATMALARPLQSAVLRI
jgi:hypothetical protein